MTAKQSVTTASEPPATIHGTRIDGAGTAAADLLGKLAGVVREGLDTAQ